MAKMTKCDKVERKVLLKELRRLGGQVIFNRESGMTVATMPSIQGNAKFGRVAVAVCSEKDTPKRKVGELIAVRNLFDGVCFPVKLENWQYTSKWQDMVYEIFSEPGYL